MSKKIKITYYILGLLVIAGGIYIVFNHNKSAAPKPNINIDPNSLTGIQIGNYPWTTGINGLDKRLSEMGMPSLLQEGTIMHIHQHLDIFINGQQITLPANIGIDDAKGFTAPI